MFRGIVFFYACVIFLDCDDVTSIFDQLFIIQIINIVITIYQFFVLGLRQDNLGGIFGTASGSNAWSNLFFCILLAYFTVKYIYEKCDLLRFIIVIASTIAIAALAEIKVFFFEFVVIIILALILCGVSKRIILVAAGSIVAIMFAVSMFKSYYPLFYAYFYNVDSILDIGRAVGGGYNIPRFGAFQTISHLFFHDSIIKNLIGLGFGACEASSIPAFDSAFHMQNGYYNYIWFGHMITFLETGYIGIILTVSFFISVFFYALFRKKKAKNDAGILKILSFSQITSIILVINFWYNNFMRGDMQYIAYFAISVVFICARDKQLD